MPSPALLTLLVRSWYAWEAIGPAGPNAPWRVSPLFIAELTPLKSGASLLQMTVLRYVRLGRPRAERVTLRVLHRFENMIVGLWEDGGEPFEVLITKLSEDWIRQHCPWLVEHRGIGGMQPEVADTRAFIEASLGSSLDQIAAGAAGYADYWRSVYRPPKRVRETPAEFTFRDIDAFCLIRGYIPMDMDDRWYIHTIWASDTAGSIFFQRSWTGYLLWEASFKISNEAVQVTSLRVNLDRDQYHYQTPAIELDRFARTASAFTTLAYPEDEASPQQAAAAWRRLPGAEFSFPRSS